MSADMDPAAILDDIVELAEARRVPVRHISRIKFDATAVTTSSQGVLARAQELPEQDMEELAKRRRPDPAFLVVVEGVTDPQNLGAIIRTAECAGVTGLLLPRHRAVHITPTVTKAAAGAAEYVSLALVGGIPSALSRLDDLGVTTVGLDADATTSLYDLPLGDVPVALVLGAEGEGLSRLARQRCTVMASLPLLGNLNSLNVAAASAVACFEVARQRRAASAEAVEEQ